MITVTLYIRKNDAASDQARSDLESLQNDIPHRLVEVDVESDPSLLQKYDGQIPFIEVGPYRLVSPFDKQKLMMTIGAASDRRGQLDEINMEEHRERVNRGNSISRVDRAMYWVSKHYLAMLNFIMLLYFGLPILAPVLMNSGQTGPASVIYSIYKPLCHQFGFRSFFLFGDQYYYPLEEAKMDGIMTFQQISGLDDVRDPVSIDRLYARQFIGNEKVGYKTALCERDVAIYAAIFLFGIVFSLTGRRIKPLHWMLWIVLGMGPIGLDGFSQLFSQMEWSWLQALLPYRESTPFLRVLTGAIFGFATAWFAYPAMEESFAETRLFFMRKFASVENS